VITVLALLVAAVFIVVLIAGAMRPAGAAHSRLDAAPSGSPVHDDLDDLEQLHAAVNAKRQARGAQALTSADLAAFADEFAQREALR
jgi:hypothetical protein